MEKKPNKTQNYAKNEAISTVKEKIELHTAKFMKR